MSDTATTLIKITSALTSPQACIKYISIGLFILITLVWVEPALVDLKLSKDRLTISLSFIGVGTGALIGHILSLLYEKLSKKYKISVDEKKAKEDEKKNADLALANKKKSNEIILENIKDSFSHLSYNQKQVLRLLTLNQCTFILTDKDIHPLTTNQFILKKVHIKDSTYLFKINPAIEDLIKAQWETEIKENVDQFLSNDNSTEILELLKTSNQEDQSAIISSKVLDTLNNYTTPIRGDYDSHAAEASFSFWFEYGYHEYLEKLLGESLIPQLSIGRKQIHFHD